MHFSCICWETFAFVLTQKYSHKSALSFFDGHFQLCSTELCKKKIVLDFAFFFGITSTKILQIPKKSKQTKIIEKKQKHKAQNQLRPSSDPTSPDLFISLFLFGKTQQCFVWVIVTLFLLLEPNRESWGLSWTTSKWILRHPQLTTWLTAYLMGCHSWVRKHLTPTRQWNLILILWKWQRNWQTICQKPTIKQAFKPNNEQHLLTTLVSVRLLWISREKCWFWGSLEAKEGSRHVGQHQICHQNHKGRNSQWHVSLRLPPNKWTHKLLLSSSLASRFNCHTNSNRQRSQWTQHNLHKVTSKTQPSQTLSSPFPKKILFLSPSDSQSLSVWSQSLKWALTTRNQQQQLQGDHLPPQTWPTSYADHKWVEFTKWSRRISQGGVWSTETRVQQEEFVEQSQQQLFVLKTLSARQHQLQLSCVARPQCSHEGSEVFWVAHICFGIFGFAHSIGFCHRKSLVRQQLAEQSHKNTEALRSYGQRDSWLQENSSRFSSAHKSIQNLGRTNVGILADIMNKRSEHDQNLNNMKLAKEKCVPTRAQAQ